MENQEKLKQDCSCSEGCCTPQKKVNLWKRLLFIIIILAAASIITVKLVGKNDTASAKCCNTTETAPCCSQSEIKE